MKTTKIINRPDSLVNDAWLNLGDLNNKEIINPFIGRNKFNIENPGYLEVSLMRQPDYLSFAAKVLLDVDLLPEQAAILEELWFRPFPMLIMTRGGGKSFMLALSTILKCALIPGTKIVGVGAAFRQARVIYEYMDSLWKNAPILRSICSSDCGPHFSPDRCSIKINDSIAIFVPLGDGRKIRGLRATTVIADEFSSIPPDIYETVVSGFAAVSARPVDNVKEHARRVAKQKLGRWNAEDELRFMNRVTNQIIIAGTADYDFMHFADYWKKYWVYINSKGNPDKIVHLPNGDMKTLRDYYPEGIPESFNSKDYCIMRIPYSLMPKGFMDDKVVARAKGSTHSSIYLKEYAACFPNDSDGFFKRSLIEGCVASDTNVHSPNWPSWCSEPFDPMVRGVPGKQYVIAVDPAANEDNLAIVVLEIWPEHTRVVYVWTTNMDNFTQRKKSGMTKDNDYYGFCARRIRNLAKVFPTENIAIDAQGGGLAIVEALRDLNKLEDGEMVFLPTNKIMKPDKELPTDNEPGLHIIHVCQFANYDFTSEANNATRKDLEDKVLLFPRFDPLTLEIANFQDKETMQNLKVDRLFDTLEDAVFEIDSLKNELSSIVLTRTGTGVQSRDRWDTPETAGADGKKRHLHKDRYSALIMANYIAHKLQRTPAPIEYNVIGGFAHQIHDKRQVEKNEQMYHGPDWYTSKINGIIGANRVKE